MSVLTYSDLFDRLKVLIKYFLELETRQTGTGATNLPLLYIKNQILIPFESQDVTAQLATVETEFESAILALGSLKLSLIAWFEDVLASTAIDLGVHSQVPADILAALANAMARDSASINAREMIIDAADVDTDGTILHHTGNTGNGRLVYTFIRPGLSPSEIAHAEVLQCCCISSTTPQQERFQLSGQESHSRDSHLGQGSGKGPILTALGASVANGDFEDWTASAADSWTAVVGAWGTEVLQEASTIYEGIYSVTTDHTEGDWKLTRTMPVTLLPDTPYIVALAARKLASATGALRFGLSNGTAKDAYVTGCVKTVDVSTLSSSFALQYLAFKTPSVVDSTWTLGISMDTPAVANIFFDLIQFGVMTAFNNMYFALLAGATGFGLDDKFGYGSENAGFAVTESAAGIIQKFIGRCFNTQLPSATGGSETIADPS